MSALRRVKVREHGRYVVLLEDRDGAGSESTGSHFAGGGEKIPWWQPGEKKSARRAVEKTRGGKVKKPTFPPRLEIPQTPGFPLSHSPGGYGRLTKIEQNRTFPFLRKGDISNVVTMGTFLMSVDKNLKNNLTHLLRCLKVARAEYAKLK